MSGLRQKIAQKLVEAQHTAAILTTFNEIDMSAAMALRKRFKEEFEKKHGIGLGFMSIFVKAVLHALKTGALYPYFRPALYGKKTHQEVCRWAGLDESFVSPTMMPSNWPLLSRRKIGLTSQAMDFFNSL